jgi:putative transcriptional regulator
VSLKDLINERGYTNYKLAKTANIGQATICELVSGKRKKIRLDTAKKIAQVLGVEIEEICRAIEGEEKCN